MDALTVDLEVRKSEVVVWTLNNVLSHLNRFLPNSALLFLYGRLIGWIPILRWRIKGDKRRGWQIVTLLDVIRHGATEQGGAGG